MKIQLWHRRGCEDSEAHLEDAMKYYFVVHLNSTKSILCDLNNLKTIRYILKCLQNCTLNCKFVWTYSLTLMRLKKLFIQTSQQCTACVGGQNNWVPQLNQ